MVLGFNSFFHENNFVLNNWFCSFLLKSILQLLLNLFIKELLFSFNALDLSNSLYIKVFLLSLSLILSSPEFLSGFIFSASSLNFAVKLNFSIKLIPLFKGINLSLNFSDFTTLGLGVYIFFGLNFFEVVK